MKNEFLFTPEQKQVVIKNAYEFGKFFAKMNFLTSWAKHHQTEFTNRLKNRSIKNQSSQLGILFAYYISIKNFDYFIKNKTFDYNRYFTIQTSTGWAGFAYYIFQSLQELKTDIEIQYFFEELHNTIFD